MEREGKAKDLRKGRIRSYRWIKSQIMQFKISSTKTQRQEKDYCHENYRGCGKLHKNQEWNVMIKVLAYGTVMTELSIEYIP